MVILASLSGIQEFLFDVRESGGGQARSLRNRSFRIQLIAECIALRLLEAAGLEYNEHLVFCAAGNVCIAVGELSVNADSALREAVADLERRLLSETHGRLRLSVAFKQSPGTFAEQYQCAKRTLSVNKLQPFAASARGGKSWPNSSLVVREVWNAVAEADRDAKVGRDLVSARWLTIRRADGPAETDELDVVGYRVRLEAKEPTQADGLVSCSNLAEPQTAPRSIDRRLFHCRRLARHIPRDDHGDAIEFAELAKRARGAGMLGVLKADADSLGEAVSEALRQSKGNGSTTVQKLSRSLDRFFAKTLEDEKVDPHSRWNSIYTVFSGGDDLLAVGPWDIMLDFAGHARKRFNEQFGSGAANSPLPTPLTISAGVAIIKPKYPVHIAAQQAEQYLEQAKTNSAPGADQPKDQCAVLGGLWKWKDHDAIIATGKRLADWVDAGVVQRGWLHTLLQLVLLRRGQAGPEYAGVHPAVATSRLAYHVARNWPRCDDPHSERERAGNAARQWIDAILHEFDQFESTSSRIDTSNLPAIVRYALLATSAGSSEDMS